MCDRGTLLSRLCGCACTHFVMRCVNRSTVIVQEAAAPADGPGASTPAALSEEMVAHVGTAASTDPAAGNGPEAAGKSAERPGVPAGTPTDADRPPAATARRLNINRTLLYLCADKELPLAVRKAFAVLTRDASPAAVLPPAAVLTLLYPSGTTAGAHIFKVPYSEEEVLQVLAEARPCAAEEGAEGGVPITADNLVYSMAGARLLAACGRRYRLRDVFLDCWRVMPTAE